MLRNAVTEPTVHSFVHALKTFIKPRLSVSGGIKAGVSDAADVPGGCRANQTLHGGPSSQDHLFADSGRQPRTCDGPQRHRKELLPYRRPSSGLGLWRHRLL